MNVDSVDVDCTSSKEEGEISDDDLSLDEVICLSYSDDNANLGVSATGSGLSKNLNVSVAKGDAHKDVSACDREKRNKSTMLPPFDVSTPGIKQALPEEGSATKRQRRKRVRPNKNVQKNKPKPVPIPRKAAKNKKTYRNGGQPNPIRLPMTSEYSFPSMFPQNGRNVPYDNQNFIEMSANQSSHPHNNIPFNFQPQPNRRFGGPFFRGKYSTNLLKKQDENYEDLLKKHKSIQEQLAKLECDSEEASSPQKSDDVEIVMVENPTPACDSKRENSELKNKDIDTEKVEDEEDDLAELRRLALMSAKNKQSQDETKITDKKCENESDVKPTVPIVNRERQNSAPFNRNTSLSRKKTSRAHTQGRNLHNDRLRRNTEDIEASYSGRRRRDSGHYSEERYRLEKERDAERRRRLEAEEQRREIQKILSLDNQAEQVERFLRYLEGHRKDKSKFDTLSELTSRKSVFKDPLPKGSENAVNLRKGNRSVPLQDNYEEVEMDIDSNPASPITGVDELNNVDYKNAMLPVPQIPQAIESYTTSDQSYNWLTEQIPYTPILPYPQTLPTAVVPVGVVADPPPPPPPLPDEPPVPEEPRPPLPALDDEDEETAILREQLLRSLMEKRNSKEKKHIAEEPILKPELPVVASAKEISPVSSRSSSPAVTAISVPNNQMESIIPPIRKVVTSVTNLPKHKPVVIRLDASSSDEDEEEPSASKTAFSIPGLDDFLKEQRKSVEVNTINRQTIQGRMKDIKEKEKELSKERELITKDQVFLRTLINRAKKYQGSLKTASQKVDLLREQLVAAEKIAKANKIQLEKTKSQAMKVKERLLKRKEKLKTSEETVVTLGREVFGNDYKPRLVMVEPTTSKRKGGNISITVTNDLASKSTEAASSPYKENAPPPPKIAKKMSVDKVREEKKRLQQLEKEFAEKIRLLKEAQAVKAIQRGSTFIPETSINKPLRLAQPQLDEIKLGGSDSDSVSEMCLPKPRRRSLAKLNSSNKPNVSTPSKSAQSITKNTSANPHLSLKLPTGLKLSNLCKLQNEKVEKVLKSKKCVSWCKRRYSRQYSYISAPVKQIPSLQLGHKAKEKKASNDTPTSNCSVTYSSPLLHFKSYRFSPFFRTKENKSIQSSIVANMTNPHQILCRFDLQGKCNDDKCAGQHISDIMLPDRGVMEDIVSYYPPLAGIDSKTPLSDYPVCISKYVESVVNAHQSKMTSDEICLLLLSKVTEAAGKSLPFTMFYKARKWHPCKSETPSHAPTTFKPDIQQSTNVVSKYRRELDDIIREEDVRYFVVEDNDVLDMESGILEDPSNIALWLKLAYKKLNDTDRSSDNSLDKALNVLARGIESNKNDSSLWYHYLLLYRRHPDSQDLGDICQTAVDLSPSYDIWWLYLESIRPYSAKSSLCEKILDFLLDSGTLNHEQRSHYLLEIVLFKVSLAVQSGRYTTGLNLLKSVIERKKDEESRIFQLLTVCDKSVMWISFLHLLELHHLPSSLFNPHNQNPSRILSKEHVTIHWKSKDDGLTPVDDMIKYFWQAIEACSGGLDQADNGHLLHCQNLFENFISYLIVQERWKDACEICRKVLQSCPSAIDMWLTAANLYASCGEENLSSAISVFDEAIKENQHSAKLFYHLANFQLYCEGADKALEVLETFVISLFQVDKNQTPDPNVLYCSLLEQAIPFSTGLIPMLKPDFSTQNSDKEILYFWLNYCFLLELQGDMDGTREMFESALTAIVKAEDLFVLWQSYLDFQCRQVDMNPGEPREIRLLQQLMNRSVVTMPTRFPVPWSEGESWVNYNLVNGLIDRCLCHLDPDDHLQALETYRDMMPDNMDLLMRACEEAVVRQEFQRASSLAISAIYDQVANIDFWKMIISAKQKEGRHREVTKLYQKSIDALPYCATLWKDFLLFEVTQGNEAMVKWLLKKNEEIGLSVQGFVATISS